MSKGQAEGIDPEVCAKQMMIAAVRKKRIDYAKNKAVFSGNFL